MDDKYARKPWLKKDVIIKAYLKQLYIDNLIDSTIYATAVRLADEQYGTKKKKKSFSKDA